MLSNISEFEALLARYDDNSVVYSKLLRTQFQADPQTFISYTLQIFREDRPPSTALKFIVGLALSAGLIEILLDQFTRNKEETIAISKRILACNSRFDALVLEFVQTPRPSPATEEALFHVGIDLLDAISEGSRLIFGILKALNHSNPRIRSKAALFIGSRMENLAWVASRAQTQDYDARVRANIIESLYGLNSDFVRQMFRDNVGDENNRVAGNALLGLYRLGDPSAIPLIYEMVKHPDARFRNTCAWLMGQTGDRRFAQTFSELMSDPEPLVRAQALKGLGKMRQALRQSATRPALRAAIITAKGENSPHLIATVHDNFGQPIQGLVPTGFVLKTGTPARCVRNYTVQEYKNAEPLNAAFVLCVPEQNEAEAEAGFARSLQACAGLRRPKDRWGVVKTNVRKGAGRSESQASSDGAFEYSANHTRIAAMIQERALFVAGSSADEVTNLVLGSLSKADIALSKPHLIIFGSSPKPRLLENLLSKGADLPAVLHVLAESATWQDSELRRQTHALGGTYRLISGPGALEAACFETYSSLLHHYRIEWQEGDVASIDLDINSEAGTASASYNHAFTAQLEPVPA